MNRFLDRTLHLLHLHRAPRAKRVVVAIIGGTVLFVGICLIVLPGPAILVIPAGLAILATEFIWARRWLLKVRQMAARAASSLRR